MSFGKIVDQFVEPIRSTIKGKRVLDLGCHDLTLTRELVKLGAKKVIGIDEKPLSRNNSKKINIYRMSFVDYLDDVLHSRNPRQWDVLFLSWPPNWHTPGLQSLVELSSKLIVISKNTDGSACGTLTLWGQLRSFKVEWSIPHPANWMHIYSNKKVTRPATGEEKAAVDQHRIYSFWEVAEYTEPVRQNSEP